MHERNKTENLVESVNSGTKKWVRYSEGAELFSMGFHTFRKLAKEAGAVYHIGRIVLVNVEKFEEYLEIFCDDPRY